MERIPAVFGPSCKTVAALDPVAFWTFGSLQKSPAMQKKIGEAIHFFREAKLLQVGHFKKTFSFCQTSAGGFQARRVCLRQGQIAVGIQWDFLHKIRLQVPIHAKQGRVAE